MPSPLAREFHIINKKVGMKWVKDVYFWIGHLNVTPTRNNAHVEWPLTTSFQLFSKSQLFFKKNIIFLYWYGCSSILFSLYQFRHGFWLRKLRHLICNALWFFSRVQTSNINALIAYIYTLTAYKINALNVAKGIPLSIYT